MDLPIRVFDAGNFFKLCYLMGLCLLMQFTILFVVCYRLIQMSKVSKRSLSISCCQFSTIMKNVFFTDLLLHFIVARGVSNVFTGSFENLFILLSSSGSHFASALVGLHPPPLPGYLGPSIYYLASSFHYLAINFSSKF